MSAENSFDTNILIYSLAGGNDETVGTPAINAMASERNRKARLAQALVAKPSVISVQLLNEFTNVARKKLGMTLQEIRPLIANLALVHSVMPLDLATLTLALEVAEYTQYGIYDSNIIAVALMAGCVTLYTEDMGHGRCIFDTLTIVNPFHAGIDD